MDVSALRADDARGGPASKPLDVEKGRDRSVELRRLIEERRVVADLTAQIRPNTWTVSASWVKGPCQAPQSTIDNADCSYL
jgi:hypothetical protein